MLLAIDIGNSEITIGLWDENGWIQHWRISSRSEQPEFFYASRMRDDFLEAGIPLASVSRAIISSVVPGLTKMITGVTERLFNTSVTILGPDVYAILPIQILNPAEIGSDLVANALAAFVKYKQTVIVVDFGTALTFTTISGIGKILGVSIAPGLQTAIRSLSQNTARLFDVPLELPASALGTSTITAIQSGVLIGYEGLVRNLVQSIRKELDDNGIVIATGGLSSVITSLHDLFHAVEPKLTLDGLRLVDELKEKSEK